LYQCVGISVAGSTTRSLVGIVIGGVAACLAVAISFPPLENEKALRESRRACGLALSYGYAAATRPPVAPKYHHHWRGDSEEDFVNVAVRLIAAHSTLRPRRASIGRV
jgi:hypothetical protein